MNARASIHEFDARLRLLAVLFTIGILVIVARLYSLQVARGQEFFRLSDQNFIRSVELTPDRGIIYDSEGRVLAENRPVYDVYLTPEIARLRLERIEREREQGTPENRLPADPLQLISDVMHMSAEESATMSAQVADLERRADILVGRNIARDQLAVLETHQSDLPGLFVRVSQHRHYPLGHLAAHIVGYMNEVSAAELEELRPFGYHRGDYIGRSGIEKSFEPILRGAPGLRRQVVDVNGNAQNLEVARQLLGAYREMEPVPGKNLHLTVDSRMQEIVDDVASAEHSVAVAAVDPRDGSVLSLFSRPSFNPNAWSGRLSAQEMRDIQENPYHPLLDKAIYAWAPGSTYKIIGAIAGLEEETFDRDTRVQCTGSIEYGGRVFRCWNRAGHGWVNLEEAIEGSCDVYFYELGVRLGMDTLAEYAFHFGFGQRAGLGIPGERSGLVPTRSWHEQNTEGGFVGGFTLGAVIGQDVVEATPVQLALAYGAIANGGTLYYPRLVDRVTNAEGRTIFEYPRRVRNTLPFSDEHMDIVRSGLERVVATGSGRQHQLEYVVAAGKTGTAQVAALDTVRVGEDGIIWNQRDHAWFAAYAPVDNPRISIVVLVEHGGQGSQVAAPLAMEIIDRYFRDVLDWDDEIELASNGRRAALQSLMQPEASATPGGVGVLEVDPEHLLRMGLEAREEMQ